MKFVKFIWSLLVGIKDALVLIAMIMFFALIFAGLSARPKPVGEGVLDLALAGSVVEQPERAGFSEVAGTGQLRQFALRDLTAALDAARGDDRVKAVALDLDGFTGGGQAAMVTLAESIRSVREAGKPVIAYATVYSDDSYLLAAAANEIWLNPLGGVLLAGPGGTQLYYKGLLDKLGVTANVYRVGTYKAAVEPFIRNDMSDEARSNAQGLADATLSTWTGVLKRLRPKAQVDATLKNTTGVVEAAGGNLAKAALDAGLVDKVADRDVFEKRLVELGGESGLAEVPYNAIPLNRFVRDAVPSGNSGNIGVVTVAGMIVDGEAGPGTAGGDTVADQIDEAVYDEVEALVLRVDSPGGSVTASERIRQALLSAKRAGIPVVVSMGNVAASGGYWVATPGDFIFAEPSTITGSIGVFGILPSFEGTLTKLGLGADGVKTTPLSGEPDLLRGPSEEADRLLQTGVNGSYRYFLDIVAKARKKTPQQVDAIAQGRVWDGGTARQLGLIDGFGNLADAIEKAGDIAKISGTRTARYYTPPKSLEDEIVELLAGDSDDDRGTTDAFAVVTRTGQRQLEAGLAEVQAILSGPTIQARCLTCGPVPVAAQRQPLRLVDVLKALVFG